jgi:hypothetical protein
MKTPLKIGIGLPVYGGKLDVGHATMWFGLGAQMAATEGRFELAMFTNYDINGIDMCRNVILYDAIENGCDWCLMVDADTFHGGTGDAVGDVGADILQMILDGERWGSCGLIGAPVHGRQVVGEVPICVFTIQDSVHVRTKLGEVAGKVSPVARIGAAFVALNCNWFRENWKTAPWFTMVNDYVTPQAKNATQQHQLPFTRLGEDYFVCDGIRSRGGVVLCDGRFVPEHVEGRQLISKRGK